MNLQDGVDPITFANQWSFNGRFYLWISFFHGLALLTGRDITAHDAFQGRIYHTEIFGPQGALYNKVESIGLAEAEKRLRFSVKAMSRLRANEVRYLFNASASWKSAGLLLGYATMIGAIIAMTYGVGANEVIFAYSGFSAIFIPFITGNLGKRLVRRLWRDRRIKMGTFTNALPWMTVSTSPTH